MIVSCCYCIWAEYLAAESKSSRIKPKSPSCLLMTVILCMGMTPAIFGGLLVIFGVLHKLPFWVIYIGVLLILDLLLGLLFILATAGCVQNSVILKMLGKDKWPKLDHEPDLTIPRATTPLVRKFDRDGKATRSEIEEAYDDEKIEHPGGTLVV
ncbi:hypothetical protein AAMO2058_000535600 [Amorphochlora amoebiformis]